MFPATPLTWIAVIWLGVLGLCVAYLLFFYLNNAVGPTRASLVTYVFPVVGVVLGIIFLSEPLTWNMIIGSILVVGGIVVVNRKPRVKTEVKTEVAVAPPQSESGESMRRRTSGWTLLRSSSWSSSKNERKGVSGISARAVAEHGCLSLAGRGSIRRVRIPKMKCTMWSAARRRFEWATKIDRLAPARSCLWPPACRIAFIRSKKT